MAKDRKDVDAALERKGFKRKEGDHHHFIYHSLAGKKTRVHTKTSHGQREISENILSQMARQCGLTNKLFSQLVECPMDRAAYEAELIKAGKIEAVPADAAEK